MTPSGAGRLRRARDRAPSAAFFVAQRLKNVAARVQGSDQRAPRLLAQRRRPLRRHARDLPAQGDRRRRRSRSSTPTATRCASCSAGATWPRASARAPEVGRAHRRRHARRPTARYRYPHHAPHEGRSVRARELGPARHARRRARGSPRSARATGSGPSCFRTNGGDAVVHLHDARAPARRPAVQDRARARRGWCSRTTRSDGAKVVDVGRHRRRAGARSRRRPTSSSIETRDEAGNLGTVAAADRARPAGAQLRRAAPRARRHHGPLPRRAPAQRGHAGGRPGRVLRRRAAQAVDLVGAPRRVGRGDAEPPQDLGAACACTPRAASRASTSTRAHARRTPRTVPVRGPERQAPPRPRRAAGHDLAGAQPASTTTATACPNLLDRRRRGQALPRLRGRRRCPRTSPTRDAPLLAWLDRERPPLRHHDRRGARRRRAARGWRTTAASSSPATRAGCRARCSSACAATCAAAGRVASFGVDSLRRQVSLTAPRADGRPDAAGDDGHLRRAPAPAARLAKPTNLVTANDDIDFFRGTSGRLRPLLARRRRPTLAAARPRPARSPRTRRPGGRSSSRRAWARGSSSASALPELPSHLSARANDPNTTALMDRTWTLLSR